MGLELVSVISSYLKHEKPSVCLTSALIEDAKDQGLGALLYASYNDAVSYTHLTLPTNSRV